MRILRLNLPAFGPFTDFSLDLSRGEEGIHFIYGPNEAGKSSALRALRQMFFGIPARTTDDFLHPAQKLRAGAAICNRDGVVVEFLRRKGNKHTLRSHDDDSILDETELKRMLGGVDARLFETLFGIDHSSLVEGGREIVEGGGDIGRVLFAAGSGIAGLRAVQRSLEKEADELFKSGQARNPAINQDLSRLDEARKRVKSTALPSSEWVEHEKALRTALEEKQTIEYQLEEKERQLGRLKRVSESKPLIARRKEVLEQLQLVAGAPLLPPDFTDKRRDAVFKLSSAQAADKEARDVVARLDREIGGLDIADHVIKQAEIIEHLHLCLGSHQKAQSDRGRLVVEQQAFEADAGQILRDLGRPADLSGADRWRLTVAQRSRIQRLGHDCQVLARAWEQARGEVNKLVRRRQEVHDEQRRLPEPRQVQPLVKKVRHIQQKGPLEEQLRHLQDSLRETEARAAAGLARLDLWTGSLEELTRLRVPKDETVDRFDADLADADADLRSSGKQVDEEEKKRLALVRQEQQMRLEQAVPTEADLQRARESRQRGWRLIREAWLKKQPRDADAEEFIAGYRGSGDLAGAFEMAVEQADQTADRLRREADRVASQARLRAEQEECSARLAQAKGQLAMAEIRKREILEDWGQQWQSAGLTPLPPKEMRAWLRQLRDLQELAENCQTLRTKRDCLREVIGQCRSELMEEWQRSDAPASNSDESLCGMLERALELADGLQAVEIRRRELEKAASGLDKELADVQRSAQEAADKVAQWQSQWKPAMQELGLTEEATPAEATMVLDRLTDLFEKLRQAEEHRQRIEGIDRDAVEFQRQVRELIDQVAPELNKLPAEQAVLELNARLARARAEQKKLEALTGQREHEMGKRAAAEKMAAEMSQLLESQCREAACSDPQELPRAEERSASRRHLEKQGRNLDEELLLRSGGASLATFVADADSIDADSLPTALRQLAEDVDALKRRKSDLDQTIGEHRNELRKWGGGTDAADAAEQANQLLARIEAHVEEYMRLRLAAVVLRDAIHHYREKNQEPVLQHACRLFAELTVGSFAGLRIDLNDKNEPVLVGVRAATKEPIGVEAMSDGTADQLYLALRFASLETYLDKNEPMPFIVDDVLVNFDDDRAAAALKALAKLSKRTQVIFFTHHKHLLELAEAHVEHEEMFVHRLEARTDALTVSD